MSNRDNLNKWAKYQVLNVALKLVDPALPSIYIPHPRHFISMHKEQTYVYKQQYYYFYYFCMPPRHWKCIFSGYIYALANVCLLRKAARNINKNTFYIYIHIYFEWLLRPRSIWCHTHKVHDRSGRTHYRWCVLSFNIKLHCVWTGPPCPRHSHHHHLHLHHRLHTIRFKSHHRHQPTHWQQHNTGCCRSCWFSWVLFVYLFFFFFKAWLW